jgi:hypothetical protein
LIVTFSPLVMRRRIADNIIATNEFFFFSFSSYSSSSYYYSHYLKISSFYSSFSRLRCRSGPMGPAGGQTRPQKGGLYFPRRSNLVFHFLFPSSFETYNSVPAAVGEPEANLLCIYAYKCVCVCVVCAYPHRSGSVIQLWISPVPFIVCMTAPGMGYHSIVCCASNTALRLDVL